MAQCTTPQEIATLNREQVRAQISAGGSDFLLYKRLLDLTPLRPKPGALAPEFQVLLEAHPDDVRFLYLYGRALIGKNTPEAILRLRRPVTLKPDFPWPYLALAEIYSSPNFKDEASLLAAMRQYRKVCPASLEGFRYVDHVKEAREAGVWAIQLRTLLERRMGSDDGKYWKLLWGAEFRSVPESKYPELRKRVALDVQRLESLKGPRTTALRLALMDGYQLTGQFEAAAKIESEFEGPDSPVLKEFRAWEAKHGLRTRNDITQEEYATIRREQGALAAEWVRKWPSSLMAWRTRLSTLPLMPGWTKGELERAGERVIELDDQRDLGWTYISERLRVAQVWIRYGVRLQDCLRIAEEARAENLLGPEEASDLTANANTIRSLASQRYGYDTSTWDAMGAVVDAALQLNEGTKARSMLARMQSWLAENWNRRGEPGSGYNSFQRLETTYAGKVAEAEGRKLDALALYTKVIGSGWVRDEVEEHARALWREQGGSDEAWELVTARQAPPKPAAARSAAVSAPAFSFAAFEKAERPLPGFTLRDMNGTVWTLDQLKRKRTFVNIWATWCGPCRQEFPLVQKLHELVKGREDVQVLTLNVDDENPGLVAPFLSANHATFPVLVGARPYVMDFIGMLGIPQNWLVDRNGVMVAKAHGFDETVNDWPARMLEQLERLP